MANQGRIKFGIDFNVNSASLKELKASLNELKNMSISDIQKAGGTPWLGDKNNMKQGLKDMRKELEHLEKALEQAYNPKLGTFELSKFNQALNTTEFSAKSVFNALQDMGIGGSRIALQLTTNMLAVDRAAQQTSSTIKKLGETMMNTIRWTITSSTVNMITSSLQQAYNYAVDLDGSLNDIRIVTGKSSEEMEKFARSANKAAKSLGASTRDYTDASLIYYQQGLNDAEVSARTETTLKAAAITGQSAEAVSEQLTAVWNGYKVSAKESELYIDKLSAVAATTAADLEELSTGMSKVASAANVMGVDVDQLNAQLATIVSVTREAPESIGTALKTVYARMSDIEAGLDTETTLGEYTSQMAQMGINVLDAQGNLRDMGSVVEEIGNKWNTLNREQQISLAQSIAGTRQYSRMMALFDNWDMYQSALTTSLDSAGALSRQHAIYLESIEAHQEQLKASAEGLYDSIFDADSIKKVYDVLNKMVTAIDHLVQSLGGMPGILSVALMLFTKIAKKNIADLAVRQKINKLNKDANAEQVKHGQAYISAEKTRITERKTTLESKSEEAVREKEEAKSRRDQKQEQLKKSIVITEGQLPIGKEAELEAEIAAEEKIIQMNEAKIAAIERLKKEEEESNSQLQKTLDLEEKIYKAAEHGNLSNEEWQEAQALIKEINADYDKYLELKEKEAEIQAQRKGESYTDVKLQGIPSSKGGTGTWNLEDEIVRETAKEQLQTERIGLTNKTSAQAQQKLTGTREEIKKQTKAVNSEKDIKKKEKAQKKLNELKEKEVAYEKELKKLKNIEADEKNITLVETQLKAEEKITKELEEQGKTIEANEQKTNKFTDSLDAHEKGEKIAKVADSISTVAVSASIGQGAVDGFMNALSSGEGMVESIISSVIAMAGAFVPLIITMITAKGTADATWASITLGASAVIAIISGVFAALTGNKEAKKEAQKEAIETANAIVEEAKANEQLYESYEKLYDEYKKTGLITDDMKSATEELIDVYNIENGELLLKQHNYEVLAEKIRAARLEEEKITKKANIDKKEAAAGQLKTNIKGVTDKTNDTGGYDIMFGDGADSDDDAANYSILESTIKETLGDGHISQKENGEINITTSSPYEFSLLYSALSEAYNKMENRSTSEVAKNVKQLLDSEDYASGSEAYVSATQDIVKTTVSEKLAESPLESGATSLQALADKKAALITEIKNTEEGSEMSDADIEKLVSEQLAAEGGSVGSLQQRQNWIDMNKSEYNMDVSSLSGKLSLDKMSDLEFSMLQSLNAQKYKNNLNQMIVDAKRKAQESIDQMWADQKDARMASYENEISKLERQANTKTGQEKANLIRKQNEGLQKQIDLLKKIDLQTAETNKKNAQNEFREFAKEQGFSSALMNGDDWDVEAIRAEINNMQNSDAEAALTAKLSEVINAQNAYAEQTAEIADLEQQQRENKIAAFEAEIEGIEAVKAQYESLASTLASISALYQEINGENEFSQLTALYTTQASQSKLAIGESKKKIDETQAELAAELKKTGADRDEAYIERLKQDLLDANSAYVESLSSYVSVVKEQLVNSINAVFEKSAEKASKGKSFGHMKKEWEWIKEDSAKYLDNVEKSYRVASLERNVLQDINKIASKSARARVNSELQKQLDILKETDKLSEEDITRAERKISLLQAEIALEEARNNKNSMRLIRGADGSYSYQYVADQNAILAAEEQQRQIKEEDYADTKSAYEASVDEFNDLYSRFAEEYAAAGTDTKQQTAVFDRFSGWLEEALQENQELADKLRTEYDVTLDSAAQAWMDGLSKEGALGTLMDDVKEAIETNDYTTTLNTMQKLLGTVADNLTTIAKEGFTKTSNLKAIPAYDTGGYTGEWGSEGKLAVLHEKELILNKEDTANFLRGINILRHLQLSRDERVSNMGKGYGTSMAAWDLANEMIIEQIVNIDAHFPNATDRSEIEEAFKDLINLATQHAYEDVRGK